MITISISLKTTQFSLLLNVKRKTENPETAIFQGKWNFLNETDRYVDVSMNVRKNGFETLTNKLLTFEGKSPSRRSSVTRTSSTDATTSTLTSALTWESKSGNFLNLNYILVSNIERLKKTKIMIILALFENKMLCKCGN
jgi:hypothetical protein